MERHLAAMATWVDLADEIIVVDSRSSDGTLDLIRQRLKHPGLRIIERDRGLYASWNEGIAATTGKWIYISTAGDLIARAHLQRLLAAGEASAATVVISPQRFVNEAGAVYVGKKYRNARLHSALRGLGTVVLAPPATRFFALQDGRPNALLGSCASDLFRGDFLRAHPFPCDYGTHGDTAWTIRHSAHMTLCLVPEAGADFCIHAKPNVPAPDQGGLFERMYQFELSQDAANDTWPIMTAWARKLNQTRTDRRNLWVGTAEQPRNRWRYLQLTGRYLTQKTCLAWQQFSFKAQLPQHLRQLA